MANFPGAKVHRVNTRNLGRGQQVLTRQLIASNLGLASSRGSPVAALSLTANAPPGLLVLSAFWQNSATVSMLVNGNEISSLVDSAIPGQSETLSLYSYPVSGPTRINFNCDGMSLSTMAIRAVVLQGLLSGSADVIDSNGDSNLSLPSVGPDRPRFVNSIAFGAFINWPTAARDRFSGGFKFVGDPIQWFINQAPFQLQVGYLLVPVFTPINLQFFAQSFLWSGAFGIWH